MSDWAVTTPPMRQIFRWGGSGRKVTGTEREGCGTEEGTPSVICSCSSRQEQW